MWFDSKHRINRSENMRWKDLGEIDDGSPGRRDHNELIVDVAAILAGRTDNDGKYRTWDVTTIWSTLVFNQYEPIMIVEPAFLEKVDDPARADKMKDEGVIHVLEDLSPLKSQKPNLILSEHERQTKWDVKCRWKDDILLLERS